MCSIYYVKCLYLVKPSTAVLPAGDDMQLVRLFGLFFFPPRGKGRGRFHHLPADWCVYGMIYALPTSGRCFWACLALNSMCLMKWPVCICPGIIKSCDEPAPLT